MPNTPNNPPDPSPPTPDYILDLSPAAAPGPAPAADPPAPNPATPPPPARPFLSIHFKCCNIYGRIYMTADRRAYAGHCPKCAKPARIAIGPNGTAARFFSAE